MFRRPYGALDIALPLTFAIILRGYFAAPPRPLVARYWILVGATAVFIAALVLQPANIPLNVLAYLLTVASILLFQSRAVVASVLLIQWFAAVFMPIRLSEYYPGTWPPTQMEYFHGYTSIAKYLSPITTDSQRLFRVAAIGLPVGFGFKSGVYQYYMLYQAMERSWPLGVATVLHAPEVPNDREGTRNLTAEAIVGTVAANTSAMVGSSSVRQMAVRYYFLGPNASSVLPKILHDHPEFKTLPGGYWTVLYDPKAQAFARAVDFSGKTSGIRALVDWDRIDVATPVNARFVDVADLYDSWWHAYASTGERLPVVDNDGKLRVVVSGHADDRITLRFENRWFSVALALDCSPTRRSCARRSSALAERFANESRPRTLRFCRANEKLQTAQVPVFGHQ